MAKPDNTYRLVFFEAPEAPEKVRDLIRGVTGLHAADAMLWIADAPGVVKHPLAEGEVRELLDGLYDLGVAAEAWRVDKIPTLAPLRNVRQMACLENGFQVKGLRKEPTHHVPWDKIELIAVGRIDQEDEVRDVVPPSWVQAASMGLNAALRRPQAVARRQRTMRVPRDPIDEAILVRRDPRTVFRLVESQLNYTYLGDRLRPSARENFPIFIKDLCDRAISAYLPESTRAFLEDRDPEEYLFENSEALLKYAQHRLLWSWYRRDRDADKATEF